MLYTCQSGDDQYYVLLRADYFGPLYDFVSIYESTPINTGQARSMTIRKNGDVLVLVENDESYTIETITATLAQSATAGNVTTLCYQARISSGMLSDYVTEGGTRLHWLSASVSSGELYVGGVTLGYAQLRQPFYQTYYNNHTYEGGYHDDDRGQFARDEVYRVGGDPTCGLEGFCAHNDSNGIRYVLNCPQSHPAAVFEYPTGGFVASETFYAFAQPTHGVYGDSIAAELLPNDDNIVFAAANGGLFLFPRSSNVVAGIVQPSTVMGVGVHVQRDAPNTACISSSLECEDKRRTGPCVDNGECRSGVCGSNQNCCLGPCTSDCATDACDAVTGECVFVPLDDSEGSCTLSPFPELLADFDAANARQGTGEIYCVLVVFLRYGNRGL